MSGKMIDFTELKAERDGTITPRAVIESVNQFLGKQNNITHLAIVVRHEDGMINTAHSTMNYLELVGLHATAQAMAIEEMDADI